MRSDCDNFLTFAAVGLDAELTSAGVSNKQYADRPGPATRPPAADTEALAAKVRERRYED
jgi:hypothetical protein